MRLPFAGKLKLVYERTLVNPYTRFYLALALFHCLLQLALQSTAYIFDNRASSLVTFIVEDSGVQRGVTIVNKVSTANGTTQNLTVCDGVPGDGPGGDNCNVVASKVTNSPIPNSGVRNTNGGGSGGGNDNSSDGGDGDDNGNGGDDSGSDDDSSNNDDSDSNDAATSFLQSSNLHRRAVDLSNPSVSKGSISLTRAFDPTSSTPVVTSVLLSQDSFAQDNAVNMSANCVKAMQWPNEILRNARREDITTIVFQVWLFGISFVAVVNESIPHLLAALLSHFLATAWSGYLLHRTLYFRGTFGSLLTNNACSIPNGASFPNASMNELDILDSYWGKKVGVVIPIIVFNVLVLPFAGYITWKLYKAFSDQSLERVGADERITMMYKFVLLFWGLQQLSAFFLVASTGLWVNEVSTGIILEIANNQFVRRTIEGVFITIMVLELPWSLLGYRAVRLENSILTIVFFVVGVLFVVARASLFASPLFRWSFVAWPFFAAISIAALGLEIIVLLSGLVCVRNYGRGVTEYLDVQSTLEASDFTPGKFSVHDNVDPDADSKAPRFSTIFPAKGKLTATYMPKLPLNRIPVPQFPSDVDLEKQQQGIIGRWIVNPASLNADIFNGQGNLEGGSYPAVAHDRDEKVNENELTDIPLKSPPQAVTPNIIRVPLPGVLPSPTIKKRVSSNGLARTMSRMSIKATQRLRISLSSNMGYPSPNSARSPRSPYANLPRSAMSQRGAGVAESPSSTRDGGVTVIPGPLARSTSHSTFGTPRQGNARFSYASEVAAPVSPYPQLESSSPVIASDAASVRQSGTSTVTVHQQQHQHQSPPGLSNKRSLVTLASAGNRMSRNTFGGDHDGNASASPLTPSPIGESETRVHSHSSSSSSSSVVPPAGLSLNLPGSRFSFLSTISSSTPTTDVRGSGSSRAVPPSSYRGF